LEAKKRAESRAFVDQYFRLESGLFHTNVLHQMECNRHMLVLGVESSCDETAIAIVENGTIVRSSVIASQTAIHDVFGGVVPEVAAREHLRVIVPTFHLALAQAGLTINEIDVIAVTQGPGLIGSLLVGISFAKALALASRKPLIPLDHVNAHLHGALLGISDKDRPKLFPALALVVSGGHTNLYYMTHATDFLLIATTIDDACGECFDKVGKLLGLSYPGGPMIEAKAQSGDPNRYEMPVMIQERSRLEFSFSGLKTHMVNLIRKLGKISEADFSSLCASFQREALGQIIRKLLVAKERYPSTRSIIVAGGVAANQEFRRRLGAEIKIPSFFPELKYCADNAAMIAAFGWYEFNERTKSASGFPDYEWDAYARYDFAKHFRGTIV
jgi:N6-L-threonylcarbamoyladenine synthase